MDTRKDAPAEVVFAGGLRPAIPHATARLSYLSNGEPVITSPGLLISCGIDSIEIEDIDEGIRKAATMV